MDISLVVKQKVDRGMFYVREGHRAHIHEIQATQMSREFEVPQRTPAIRGLEAWIQYEIHRHLLLRNIMVYLLVVVAAHPPRAQLPDLHDLFLLQKMLHHQLLRNLTAILTRTNYLPHVHVARIGCYQ